MPQYKLTYFNLRGLGEVSRLILEYNKIPYEDNRIDQETWPSLKPSTPYGQVPVLEVDGKQLGQSSAIARYLARQYGLAGKNELEQAYVDSVVDFHRDGSKDLSPYFGILAGRVEGDKDEATKQFLAKLEERLPTYEKLLKNSGSGFVANNVTWADFFIVENFVTVNNLIPTFFSSHTWIKEYVSRVHSLPQIKDYVAKRPVTQF